MVVTKWWKAGVNISKCTDPTLDHLKGKAGGADCFYYCNVLKPSWCCEGQSSRDTPLLLPGPLRSMVEEIQSEESDDDDSSSEEETPIKTNPPNRDSRSGSPHQSEHSTTEQI